MMDYDDRHRIFLQGIMNSGILSRSKAKTLLKKAYHISGQSLPSDPSDITRVLHEITYVINEQIRSLNFSIVKAVDENKITKEGYFVLINQLDRSEELTELTKKSMVEFAPYELEFLKILVDEMMKGSKDDEDNEDEESDDDGYNCEDNKKSFTRGEISETRALNLGSKVKSKTLKPLEVQEVIDKFIEKKWLRSSENEIIYFTPRFIVEMESYLRFVYPDELQTCSLCNKMVIKSLSCICEKHFHLYCLGAAIPKGQNREEATQVACPKCKSTIKLKTSPKDPPGGRKRSHEEYDE